MPNAGCVCGAKVQAPTDMGVVRQRDFVLDWFTEHLNAVMVKRRADRAAARAAK